MESQYLENSIIKSAFQFENGIRIIVFTGVSGNVKDIKTFMCDESWNISTKPYAECPLTDKAAIEYHLNLRNNVHDKKDFVAEYSTPLDEHRIKDNTYAEFRKEGAYICIAYRYGHKEGHSYLVDVCGGIDEAKEVAENEANERGGKYSVSVFAKHIVTGQIDEIYEAKCPEQYTKGTHPFIAKRDYNNAIESIDFELAAIEDYAHGEVGNHITKLRGKIQEYKK